MATLGSLRNVVARKTGLQNTAGSTDRTLIDEWINQGVEHVLLRTHCRVVCSSMNTTADVWKYDLPSAILALKDIWSDSSNVNGPLERIDPDTLLTYHQASTGDGSSLRYSVMGSNLLLLYPTPTVSYELDVFYVPKPATATSDTDDLSGTAYGVPREFHKAIELYALWQAGDFTDDQSSQSGELYRAQLEEFLKTTVLPAINRKGGNSARARTRRFPTVVGRNDVY